MEVSIAHAMMDTQNHSPQLLEMKKLSALVINAISTCHLPIKKLIDVDECSTVTHTCHEDALCRNEIGSFSCFCSLGFIGDGFTCEG